MSRFPRELVVAVRERTDLVEIVSRHVSLVRKGRSHVGLCPFHQERTPSFHVIPEKQIFHCFGCQAGGDVFKFLMMVEGLSFTEAVRELAEAAGVTIEERSLSPAEVRALKQRATLFDALEAAAGYYESVLWTRPEGEAARRYLAGRGLSPDTQRAARLGYAPGGWSRLLDHLHREGYDAALIEDAGLARPRKSSDGRYDTLRERVTIPIRDERGRVIAFGGRLMEGDGPKYLNTPETAIYKKSDVVYGIERARMGVQRRGRCIVVEGYFDVLSLVQAGFDEAIATCGTALTPQHLERIRRLTRDVVLLLDSDQAGIDAAERALPMFIEAGIQPWRVELPNAKDPDEFLREHGADGFEQALARREPLLEWVVRRKLSTYGASAMSRERALEEVAPLLGRVADPALVSRIARGLGVHEEVVQQRVRQAKHSQEAPVATELAPSGWRPHRDVVHLLWLLVHRRAQVADLISAVPPMLLSDHPEVQPTLARLLSGEPIAEVAEHTTDAEIARTLRAIAARTELYTEDSSEHAVMDVLTRLWRPLRDRMQHALADQLQHATSSGDASALRAAVSARQALTISSKALERSLQGDDVQEKLRRLLDCVARTST